MSLTPVLAKSGSIAISLADSNSTGAPSASPMKAPRSVPLKRS